MDKKSMKVLFVSSGNSSQGISPFVKEQGEALKKLGIHVDFFLIRGKGITGYFKNILYLRKYLKHHHYDILHGHFIWSIFVCLFQPKLLKVGTFHGTDLNRSSFRYIADKIVMPRLDLRIVVSNKMAELVPKHDTIVIPCGIDFETFYPISDREAISDFKIIKGKINILFCSDFQRVEKNSSLAFKAIEILKGNYSINLIELKALERQHVNLLLNCVDLLLMTSLYEGSPQIIKEAMACNCPIVTTDVGDVIEILNKVEGCFVTSYEPSDVAANIDKAIHFMKRTDGRNHVQRFSNTIIAERILFEYDHLVKKRKT